MKLTYIVSTFNRPATLLVMLACLSVQSEKDIEVIVTDNSDDNILADKNAMQVRSFGDRFRYLRTQLPEPYEAAEIAVRSANGKYIAFPSDDDYYVPHHAELFIAALDRGGLDFAYSNGVYEPWATGRYTFFDTKPKSNCIDKCSFVMRRDKFTEFPNKYHGSPSDGWMIDNMIRAGLKHSKVSGILWVHN